MIRALAIAFCLAGSVAAQTPAHVSAANVLKTCVNDAQGTRDATRIGQLDASLAQLPNRRWINVTEVAQNIYHVSDKNGDFIIEFKLRDASGTAHCLVFGRGLTQGQAALTADKFVEFRFLSGLEIAPPTPGLARRYVLPAAPYTAELIAYQVAGRGEFVGFAFQGLPDNNVSRSLTAGDPTVVTQNVQLALSNAINLCLRNYFAQDTLDALLPASGFDVGFIDGRNQDVRTLFSADNAVAIIMGPGRCEIATNYMSPAATVQITQTALQANAPGQFTARVDSGSGCFAFYAAPTLNAPLSLNVRDNSTQAGRATCTEDGTSRITFVVAG